MDAGGLLCALAASTDGRDAAARAAAEAQLQAAAAAPGFGPALLQVALSQPAAVVPDALRQLAAVLLKQYVRGHWADGERGYVGPEAPDADKTVLRAELPRGLADKQPRVRTAIATAIAAVAAHDWPACWPGLMEALVAGIRQRSDRDLMLGCLRCLGIMATDLDNEQAPQLLQVLSPALLAISADSATPRGVVATCLGIMAELAGGLGELSGTYQRQVRDLLVPLVQPWVSLVCGVLGADVADASSWGPKLAALRLAQPLVAYFSKPLHDCMNQLTAAAWQLLLAAQPLHQQLLLDGDGGAAAAAAAADAAADGYTGDEEPITLETLLAQLFEVLLCFIGPARFRAQLEGSLQQMVHVALAYMQMTEDQAETWLASATQFLADEEDDVISSRASAELLLCELADEFDAPALAAVMEAAGRRIAEADEAAAHGREGWWRLREAALLALGSVSNQLINAAQGQRLPAPQLQAVLDALQRDLAPLLHAAAAQPDGGRVRELAAAALHEQRGASFLAARALLVGAKLSEAASPAQRESLLQAAATAVVAAPSPVVTISGFRALAALAPASPPAVLQPLLPTLLAALVEMLPGAGEEAMHLVLELLRELVDAASRADLASGGFQLSESAALAVARPVLQAWTAHAADPLIAPDARAVIAALASHASCLPGLAAAAVPPLASILACGAASRTKARNAAAAAAAAGPTPGDEVPMLLEGSLDLLATLVSPEQPAVAAEICRGVLAPLVALTEASDDAAEVGSAVALLLALLRSVPPAELLACDAGAGPGSALPCLLSAARALLAPTAPEAISSSAGPLLTQLLRSLPAQMAAAPPPSSTATTVDASTVAIVLLQHVAAKMASGACSPATVASLLQFVTHLALSNAAALVQALAVLQLPQLSGGQPTTNTTGLAVVVPLWLEHAPDMAGALLTRQTAVALLLLLQQRGHPGLGALFVPGPQLLHDDTQQAGGGGGRVTRSQARRQGGLRYREVSAAHKVLHVLGGLLAAEAEGARASCSSRGGGAGGNAGAADVAGDAHLCSDADDDSSDSGSEVSDGGGLRLRGAALIGVEDWDEEDMDRSIAPTPLPDDPADAADPLMRTSVRALLRDGLAALHADDPSFLTNAAASLGDCREIAVLRALLEASGA